MPDTPAPSGCHHQHRAGATRRSTQVTDQISEEVLAWQTRPGEALYPVIYLDAIMVKIRGGAHVSNRAAHIAVGVDMEGVKHVLGIWAPGP